MMSKLRILIIADEVWNDDLHGNNVLSNWFSGFDAEFAEIYCSPGIPNNEVCSNYFQITDSMMVKSLFGKPAGKRFSLPPNQAIHNFDNTSAELPSIGFYNFMKSIAGEFLRTVRDIIWLTGRYNKKEMKKFIDDFQPDIIFSTRLLTPKLMRLEKIVSKITTVPFVAFTADDEASFRQLNYSPLYWIKRWLFRFFFRKHINLYKHYFTFSKEQAIDYTKEYGVTTSVLHKSGIFSDNFIPKNVQFPIKIVYAGRLYCNRWKTLADIAKAVKNINKEETKIAFDIYTQENVTKEQYDSICTSDEVQIKGKVSPVDLVKIYNDADIALHVESLDRKYRLATRVSFSTKLIDLMASTCAILAVCWDQHAGYQYLKENELAFLASDPEEIEPLLINIVNNPELVNIYSKKAWEFAKKKHSRKFIQDQINSTFRKIVEKFQLK